MYQESKYNSLSHGKDVNKPDTKITELVNVLNGTFSQMKLSDRFLSKLPDNSWSITVNLDGKKINIVSFRNDSTLMETGNFSATDEMYWYSKVIPMMTAILAENISILSSDDVVRFMFKNEEHEIAFS